MNYVGTNNEARKTKSMYAGINGVAKKVLKVYVGLDNVARLVWIKSQPIFNLPIGSLIKIPIHEEYHARWGKEMLFRIVAANHPEYPLNSITLVTDKVIQIMCFDGKEIGNPIGDRSERGNNNFIVSNIRQWLNSSSRGGTWYSAQHEYDAPPTQENYESPGNYYDSWDGFLCLFPEKFLPFLMDTTFKVANPPTEPTTPNNVNSFVSKFALISYAEMGFGTLPGTTREGVRFAYFEEKANRKAYPTLECVNSSNGYASGDFGVAIGSNYSLRSPDRASETNGYAIRCTTYQGEYNAISRAFRGYVGIRPVCNVPNNMLVTSTPDQYGVYSFVL